MDTWNTMIPWKKYSTKTGIISRQGEYTYSHRMNILTSTILIHFIFIRFFSNKLCFNKVKILDLNHKSVYYRCNNYMFSKMHFGKNSISVMSQAFTPKLFDNLGIRLGFRWLFAVYVITYFINWTQKLMLYINSS